jgi:hypothetical protein
VGNDQQSVTSAGDDTIVNNTTSRISVGDFFAPVKDERREDRGREDSQTGTAAKEALVVAREKLAAAMGERGLQVIKHGRQGAPKKRALFLSQDGGQLIIQAEDHYKTVKLAGVESIRLGSDIDPATNPLALQKVQAEGVDGIEKARKSVQRPTIISGLIGNEKKILFGTANLRRSCDATTLNKCISLILPTRTVDFECVEVEDLRILKETLTTICNV